MGFDEVATFSGKKKRSSGKNEKELATCYLCALSLACVQAANHTEGIKHVDINLITLWKFSHYSPKISENLKEVQRILNLPESKTAKPADTRWLAHERCVKTGQIMQRL